MASFFLKYVPKVVSHSEQKSIYGVYKTLCALLYLIEQLETPLNQYIYIAKRKKIHTIFTSNW